MDLKWVMMVQILIRLVHLPIDDFHLQGIDFTSLTPSSRDDHVMIRDDAQTS